MTTVFLFISFLSSVIGAICGIGGGIIIKPILDLIGLLNVAAVNFLSGCTVLAMSLYSVLLILIRKDRGIDLAVSIPLAVGAALGGITGKMLFQFIWVHAENQSITGMIQSVSLVVVMVGPLIYMICKNRIATRHYRHQLLSVAIGIALGFVSSFLGIGGGPINLIVLYYFYSMRTQTAVKNSLFIVLVSQITNLVQTILSGTIPQVDFRLLALMILGGFAGGITGRRINRSINPRTVDKLFMGLMCVIISINVINIFRVPIGRTLFYLWYYSTT